MTKCVTSFFFIWCLLLTPCHLAPVEDEVTYVTPDEMEGDLASVPDDSTGSDDISSEHTMTDLATLSMDDLRTFLASKSGRDASRSTSGETANVSDMIGWTRPLNSNDENMLPDEKLDRTEDRGHELLAKMINFGFGEPSDVANIEKNPQEVIERKVVTDQMVEDGHKRHNMTRIEDITSVPDVNTDMDSETAIERSPRDDLMKAQLEEFLERRQDERGPTTIRSNYRAEQPGFRQQHRIDSSSRLSDHQQRLQNQFTTDYLTEVGSQLGYPNSDDIEYPEPADVEYPYQETSIRPWSARRRNAGVESSVGVRSRRQEASISTVVTNTLMDLLFQESRSVVDQVASMLLQQVEGLLNGRLGSLLDRLPRFSGPYQGSDTNVAVEGDGLSESLEDGEQVGAKSEHERLQRKLGYARSGQRAALAEVEQLRRRQREQTLVNKASWSVSRSERNGDLLAMLWSLV